MQPSRPRWPYVLLVLVTAGIFAGTARLPFFHETWSRTLEARQIQGIGDLFDPTRVPLRPFQHAWFWGLAALWPLPSAVARLPAFLAHLAACALVAALARRLGADRPTAALAALSFALFPNVKGLVYVSAVAWPFRVLATLLGLVSLLAHAERPRARTGLVLVAAFLLALACHQGAVVFPAFGALLLLARHGRGAARLARDPWVIACAAAALMYVIYVGLLHEREVHTVSAGASLPVNAVRALLYLVPGALRMPLIEGLGSAGAAQATALVALSALALFLGWWFWRAAATVRALLLCLPFEWAPAVLVTAFVQRYSHLASAFLALALALAWQHARGREKALVGVLGGLLLCGWTLDTVADVWGLRTAGRAVDSILQAATQARARAGPGSAVTLLDPPLELGRERQFLILNHEDLPAALELRGVEGPWTLLWTSGPSWRAGILPQTHAEVLGRLRRSGRPYVAFDPRTGLVEEAR